MSPRKTAVLFTTEELKLISNLLRNHVEVAQYEPDSFQAELAKKLKNFYEIAKELEPIS